jgi:hypothetical protein
METILNKKDKPAVDEMIDFLKTLSEEQQHEVNSIMKGIAIGVKLARKAESKKGLLAAGM